MAKDPQYLERFVRKYVGELTFLEAFDRTGRIINVMVTAESSLKPMLLHAQLPECTRSRKAVKYARAGDYWKPFSTVATGQSRSI